MDRKQFNKKHFLLEIEYSEAIAYYRNKNRRGWNTDLVTDFHCYTNQCHLLYNEFLNSYVAQRVDSVTKLSDFKNIAKITSQFHAENKDILWMNENDPTYPDWRYASEQFVLQP